MLVAKLYSYPSVYAIESPPLNTYNFPSSIWDTACVLVAAPGTGANSLTFPVVTLYSYILFVAFPFCLPDII